MTDGGSSGLSGGEIAGIVIGGLLAVLVVLVLLFFGYRWYSARSRINDSKRMKKWSRDFSGGYK